MWITSTSEPSAIPETSERLVGDSHCFIKINLTQSFKFYA